LETVIPIGPVLELFPDNVMLVTSEAAYMGLGAVGALMMPETITAKPIIPIIVRTTMRIGSPMAAISS
jgi:hypothetical protein